MKKNYFIFGLLILFISCQKNPDMGELDDDYIVVTDHDAKANFSTYSMYYMPDSILVIGNSLTPTWIHAQSNDALAAIEKNMNQRGFTRTRNKRNADLGIQTAYVESTNYITYDPYWWAGYPGYWDPSYWGGWSGWYYPYPVVYSYNVGSLLAQIVDLKNVPTGSNTNLTVLWTAYMAGLMSGSNNIDMQRAVTAVNQSFVQSPYIQK